MHPSRLGSSGCASVSIDMVSILAGTASLVRSLFPRNRAEPRPWMTGAEARPIGLGRRIVATRPLVTPC